MIFLPEIHRMAFQKGLRNFHKTQVASVPFATQQFIFRALIGLRYPAREEWIKLSDNLELSDNLRLLPKKKPDPCGPGLKSKLRSTYSRTSLRCTEP